MYGKDKQRLKTTLLRRLFPERFQLMLDALHGVVDRFQRLFDARGDLRMGETVQIQSEHAPFHRRQRFFEVLHKLFEILAPDHDLLGVGEAQTPRVIVRDKAGNAMSSATYTVSYRDNTNPGTAWVDVTMGDKILSAMFKIYLPATTKTYVENRADGVRVGWKAVPGAKGYVIYSRAWNLISSGWTTFERWNNTTDTEWTDTKVYVGTRYQYGVKAYFSDPMDNYNLGIVGPLKTTVRITTRELVQVRPGSKEITVKWKPSKVFTGYQIQYATDSAFKQNATAIKISDPATYWTTLKGLQSNTTYYVRIRSYQVFEGMTYFGEWSNVLSCKVK